MRMVDPDDNSLVTRAVELLQSQSYLNIATAHEGQPWNTPVWGVVSTDLGLYWSSWINAVHSQNIVVNPRVFITLFDSSRKRGTNNMRCLYLQCTAAVVTDRSEAQLAAKLIYPDESVNVDEFLGEGIKRFYKALPEKAWLNCLSERELAPTTVKMRVEVSLERLREVMRSVLLLLLFLLLAPFMARAEKPTEIKVGAIYAMTGDWASWGKNCQQGTELALAELKRDASTPKITLVLEDSPNAKPTNALSAFKKLTDIDRVQFILGPMSPEEYAAVAPVADRKGVPLMPFVSSRIVIPAAVFMWMDPETQARRIADYVALRHRSVAILSSNQDWDVQVGQAFKRRLLERGVAVPVLEEPPFDSSEVRSQIAKLSLSKVDAIFVTSYLLFSQYLKALGTAQIKLPMYGIELDQSAISSAGAVTEGLQFIRPAAPDKKFRDAYQAMWGAEPDIPASQCYDSVMILSKAVAAGVKDKESFAAYFSSRPPHAGASGLIAIQKGKTIMSTDLFEVRNGKMSYLQSIGG